MTARRRRTLYTSLTLIALALTACQTPERPATTEVDPNSPRRSVASPRRAITVNDRLDDVAAAEPAFAGVFYDSAGRFTVAVTNADRSAHALSVLAAAFPAGTGIGRGARNAIRMTHVVKYSFAQLRAWNRSLRTVRAHAAIVSTAIDHARNQMVIGISTADALREFQTAIAAAGLPDDAWRVKISAISPVTTINERYRPLRSALQIGRRIQNSRGIYGNALCTMSALVRVSTVPGFLTNSHCTSGPLFTVSQYPDSLRYHQHQYNNFVGTETIDPALEQCDAVHELPAGSMCRYTETAFIALDASVTFHIGRIVATTGGQGSKTIDSDTSHHWITRDVDYAMVQGEAFTKIGQTTGRRDGTILLSCVDLHFPLGGQNTWLPCQQEIAVHTDFGDSGSPVFQTGQYPGDPYGVKLMGIYHTVILITCVKSTFPPQGPCTEGYMSPASQLGGPDYDYFNIVLW